MQGNIRQAFEYAAKNPNSDFARNLEALARSGALDVEAKRNNIDLTPFKPKEVEQNIVEEKPKKSLLEKVTSFTGGEKIAQGLGQAIANKEISKQIEETQAQQNEIQTKLIAKIREKRELGEDTSRLENALSLLSEDMQETGEGAIKLLNQNDLTGKQVIGDALQLGTTIVGAGTLPGVAKTATTATTIGKGIAQGAKSGAIAGGIYGASSGVSKGLKEDKTTGEIIGSGIKGGIGGAITGGAVGAVAGGITGAIRGRQLAKTEKAIDAVTPNTRNLSSKKYTKLLEQGRITPKTGTKSPQYILSEAEKETALKYQHLLKTKDPVKNINNVMGEVAKKDKEVGVFLKKNNGIFNTGELKNSLVKKLENIDDLTVDEAKLSKVKEATVDNFIKSLKKNDMETLWRARKTFDRTIEKAFSGSPTLQNTMKIEFRNGIQDFIVNRTPDGVYKTSMAEMSNLYKLNELLKVKALSEKGTSAIKLWIRSNPVKAKLIGWGAPAIAGGAIFLD